MDRRDFLARRRSGSARLLPTAPPLMHLLPLLLLITGLVTGCATPAAAPVSDGTVRIVTYNIRAGTDLEGRPSLERVVELVDSLRADIVLLQEVDRRTRRSGGVDQLAVLGDATGMEVAFGRALDFDGGQYGNGLLSRWPIRSARTIPLAVEVPDELAERYYEPRSLLHVQVETSAGVMHLLNTHLDHHQDPIFRHQQMLHLLAHLAEEVPAGELLVLGGDLNARPEAVEIRALGPRFSDAWAECGDGPGHTFPAGEPDRRIDYIMLRGLRCTAAGVPATLASDHRPVVVDVRVAY